MSEKAPRIKPHTMQNLANRGAELYHPLTPDAQRRLGQISFTDKTVKGLGQDEESEQYLEEFAEGWGDGV